MSPFNFSRCQLINVGAQNSEIGIGSKGQLSPVGSGYGVEFIIKPVDDSFRFYKLVDGVQKLISVCESNETPSLTMMKENKNLKQNFMVQEVEGSVFQIGCDISGALYFVTLNGDKIELAPALQNNSQKWKLEPC